MKKFSRRYLTLIEMMIVMFIISLLIGFLAYRYTGSLEESKAFKTKVAIERVSTILNLKAANDPGFLSDVQSWQEIIKSSPLVSNPKDLIYDGWGNPFEVYVNDGTIYVASKTYEDYIKKNPQTMFSNEGTRQ